MTAIVEDDGWPLGLPRGQIWRASRGELIYCTKENDTPRKVCSTFNQDLKNFMKLNKKWYGVFRPSSRFRANTLLVLPSKTIKKKKKTQRFLYKAGILETIETIAKKFEIRDK